MFAFKTADAAERLAKKQAAKQLGVGAAIDDGLTVKVDNRNPIAKGYDAVRSVPMPRLSTPVNTGGGVSMGGIANPIESNVEPVRQAGRRAVGDITAIPGVGKPSASPTARDFREGNYVAPIVDYATLLGTAASASPKVRNPIRPTAKVMAGFAPDQSADVLRALSNDIAEYVQDIGRINPNLVRQYNSNKNLFDNLTPKNLSAIRRLDPDFDDFIQNYIGADKDYLQQQGLLGWPDRTTNNKTFAQSTQERRAAQISKEYGVDLDEALIMAEVEDDFRAAIIRDAGRIASPETRQQFIQWAKSTPIEQIRAQDPNFNSLFVRMSEMGGFGE